MIKPSLNHVFVTLKLQQNVDCPVLQNLRFGRNFRGLQIQLFAHWKYFPIQPSNQLKLESICPLVTSTQRGGTALRCCQEQPSSILQTNLAPAKKFPLPCRGSRPGCLNPSEHPKLSSCQNMLLTIRGL